MGDDNKKETQAKSKTEYTEKILGEPGFSLIDKDPAEQKKKLSLEAERLSKTVAGESSSAAVSGDCTKLLDEARTLLKEANPDANTVLSKFDRVKQRLLQAYNSREAQPGWFSFVVIYNLLYLAIIILLIIWYKLIPGQDNLQNTAFVCLACTLWGGLGGVVDAFFAMHAHFSQQDFDTNYWPWYYLHPLLGLSMGAVVFLILQAGLLTVSKTTLQETAGGTAGVTALPIALSFLAGFRQSAAQGFLARIIKAVFQRE
jgi:hypothetical protein